MACVKESLVSMKCVNPTRVVDDETFKIFVSVVNAGLGN